VWLLGCELRLKQDFERDYQQRFKLALNAWLEQRNVSLSGAIGTGGLHLNLKEV